MSIVPFTWVVMVSTNNELFRLEAASKADPLVLRDLGGEGSGGEVGLVACCEVASSACGGSFGCAGNVLELAGLERFRRKEMYLCYYQGGFVG